MEAEAEDRALIKLQEKVLGPEHPGTLEARCNLAQALAHQGKYVEAEKEARAVIELREKVLGPEHPDTLRSCFELAICLRAQSETQEATAFAQRAAEGARKALGPEHPDTKKYEQLRQQLLVKSNWQGLYRVFSFSKGFKNSRTPACWTRLPYPAFCF